MEDQDSACSDFSNIGRKLYSDAGCLTNVAYSGTGYSKNMTLGWNSKYELTTASTNGTECERNGYNVLGQRAWTWDGTETNYFVYDGAHAIAEVDATGGLKRAYVAGVGIDNWLAMTVYTSGTETTYFYITDHLGAVHALADEDGDIVESYRYDAWGRVLGVYDGNGAPLTKSAIGNRILWQGREYSWETGLYYFRARWFDPVVGRWLSNDPIGISGGLNQYVFCGDNPVNIRDPSGLCTEGGRATTLTPAISNINLNVSGKLNAPLTASVTYSTPDEIRNTQVYFWTCTWQGFDNLSKYGAKHPTNYNAYWKPATSSNSIQYNSGFPPDSMIIFYSKITGDVVVNGQTTNMAWYPSNSVKAYRKTTEVKFFGAPIKIGEKVTFEHDAPPGGIE